MTYLLHAQGVSWGYFDADLTQPSCSPTGCTMKTTVQGTPIWQNPLPWFTDVQQDGQLGNISTQSAFFDAVSTGGLPAVSWVVPNRSQSGHPGSGTNPGSEQFVVSVINAIESSPAWSSTAILLSWDDWGGEYDHVPPPAGYGLRVPGIVISPYANRGRIDHQTLSFDSYNRFIEDTFLHGQRLDPANDGRPDSRLTVRENDPQLGDLSKDFNFTQPPSAPILLATLDVPAQATPNTTVSVHGAYFQPGDTVNLKFNCGAPDCTAGTPLGIATAGVDGRFTTMVTVPTGLAAGSYFVSAEGSDPLTYFAVASTQLTSVAGVVAATPVDGSNPD
jgi:phospholipase C